ncbi:hypothetical protein [Candidatus Methylocalor cossyra]|uniref:Uncharacterized protein n=1 Tax=Candidatus Methylocalor cossyra TaxID=3108543 RepID=A0ABP1CAS7_9GAMM
MKLKCPLVLLAALGSVGSAGAAQVIGGTGIGYSTNPITMVARLVFDKKDLKPGAAPLVVKSGDNVAPPEQQDMPITVPPTKSMAWCDPVSNPTERPVPTDFSKCYGWAMFSKWFLIDLSALKKQGVGAVWVSIRASRLEDQTALGDLIPALTVWRGQQNLGSTNHWYPNMFQTTPPFWAWKLTPFTGPGNQGWATAYDSASKNTAAVIGKVPLKGGDKDYLTVAVGGDARHLDPKQKHDVNFQLAVSIAKKKPVQDSTPPPAGGKIDQYGCTVGATCWHPPMNHCMAVSLCNLPQYKGECLCTQ